MSTKAAVRSRLRAMAGLTAEVMARESGSICNAILEESRWQNARTVALFAAHSAEPSVEALCSRAPEKRFCFPRVRDLEIDFFEVTDPATLVVAPRWNLREPEFDPARLVALAEIDLIVVPGMAFTRGGQRLGRGGGYYDRLLAQPALRAFKLGVCFQGRLLEQLPSEPHDVAVDVVVVGGG